MRIKLGFLALLFSTSLWSSSYSGIGEGHTLEDAKKAALSDLSSNLFSEVKSRYYSFKNSKNEGIAESELEVTSSLPILAAEFEIISEKPYSVKVILKDNAIAAYKNRASDIAKECQKSFAAALGAKDTDQKSALLEEAIKSYDEYARIKSVISLLGSSMDALPLSRGQISAELDKISKKIDTIDRLIKAFALTKYENVYVFAPIPSTSTSPTEFSMIIKDRLESAMKGLKNQNDAKYRYIGKYRILKNAIEMTYTLYNGDGAALESKTVSVDEGVYVRYGYKPLDSNFEALLQSGIVVSDDFRVSLGTDRGSNSLVFKKGDRFRLIAKLSQIGEFYIVGHSKKPGENLSYLIEINENASGSAKFIKRISGDEINKEVVLGEYEVMPPFGIESFQIIATTKNAKIPQYIYDKNSGLYVVGNTANDGIVKTRAISKVKDGKEKNAENILMMTTFDEVAK
ncbi:MAG TPA: hypothetical protein PKW30_05950 [Campylobacterales bacterium]|mgnify:CR=1 FL=1|nr:hypothetical protein [Campylobacterales bacterium]